MTIRAVLFDVGGPLDTEVLYERLIDHHIREALAANGIAVSDQQFETANRLAVASFAGNAYQAIIWELCAHDTEVARRSYQQVVARADQRHHARGGFELREGMPELLQSLRTQGLLLGLAANQPVIAVDKLDRLGIGHYFHYRDVSATHGYYKPDPRLFLHACEALGLPPADCLMVGDRIDNDIASARLLGMTAVRFRTGRHAEQRPRSWLETPDADVNDVAALQAAIVALIDGAAGPSAPT